MRLLELRFEDLVSAGKGRNTLDTAAAELARIWKLWSVPTGIDIFVNYNFFFCFSSPFRTKVGAGHVNCEGVLTLEAIWSILPTLGEIKVFCWQLEIESSTLGEIHLQWFGFRSATKSLPHQQPSIGISHEEMVLVALLSRKRES